MGLPRCPPDPQPSSFLHSSEGDVIKPTLQRANGHRETRAQPRSAEDGAHASSPATVEAALNRRSCGINSTAQSSIAIEKEKTNGAEPGKNVREAGKTLAGNCLGVQGPLVSLPRPTSPGAPRETADGAGGWPVTREPNPPACGRLQTPEHLETVSAGNIKCITTSSW